MIRVLAKPMLKSILMFFITYIMRVIRLLFAIAAQFGLKTRQNKFKTSFLILSYMMKFSLSNFLVLCHNVLVSVFYAS